MEMELKKFLNFPKIKDVTLCGILFCIYLF